MCLGLFTRVLPFAFFFCVSTVVVCYTLDAFAPSPGDGPAAMAAGPAADAFSGSGGSQNSFLCESASVWVLVYKNACVNLRLISPVVQKLPLLNRRQ